MAGITTHVLDTSLGRPAPGVPVVLERREAQDWKELGHARTDADGRVLEWLPLAGARAAGIHRLRFDTAAYFGRRGVQTFHPEVVIVFEILDATEPHHVPLLLAPHGYTTYRGS